MRRLMIFRPLAILVGAALALSGCVPAVDESEFPAIDPTALEQVEKLRSLPFDDASIAVATSALESAGVAIADTWDPDASAVVRITPGQVQNMAAEAANGGGVSGAELEAVAAAPDGVAPIGYLISAWAISFDSDGARFAHALLGEQDFHHPETILFPSLVTTLFLADATADYDAAEYQATRAAGVTSISTAGFPDSRAAGVCSAVGNFIQRAIATVVNALKVDTSGGGFFGFLGKIWNTVVDLATGFVKGLIEAITRPVVQLIVTIFGALETIRQLSTYLVAWRSTLVPKPETNLFGIDDAKIHGRVTLTVLDNRIPIPEAVLECADLFGVNLRDAGSAAGSAVSWTATNMARADLSRLDSAEDVLDRNQVAQYDYLTGQESAKTAEGEEHAGLLKLVSSVHRNDIEKVRQLFTALVFDQVPSSIRGIVEAIAGPILDSATNHLTSITDVRSTGYVAITFHGEPSPELSAPATDAPGPGDICGIVSDEAVAAVLDAEIVRREPFAEPGVVGCTKGPEQTTTPNFVNVYVLEGVTITDMMDDPSADAPSQPVEGVGDRAVYLTDAGTLIIEDGDDALSVQVYKAGVPGSLENCVTIAIDMLDRRG